MLDPSRKPPPHRSIALDLRGIRKSYGKVTALKGIDLVVRTGEFVTILGPSGSGKSSLLKIVAGFENPDAGDVLIGGREVTHLPASARDIGMVFQNFALFPHLTVERNVSFPLEMRKVPRAEIARRVENALRLVSLSGYGSRYPRQLSGGQQQRVALARAVVFEPKLLLLDEPFSALDRKLREAMQIEVKELQNRLGLTTVFITHDQEEALIMSDQVAVMDEGVIQQFGAPDAIYHHPANRQVAEFVGDSNQLEGSLVSMGGVATFHVDDALKIELGIGDHADSVGTPGRVHIRPEAVRLDRMIGGRQRLPATVESVIFLGPNTKYIVRTHNGHVLTSRTSTTGPAVFAVGDQVDVVLAAEACRVLSETPAIQGGAA